MKEEARKHIVKSTFTVLLALLFTLGIFAKPILAASDFYESTWQGKHYIARANVTPHYSEATLEYQDQIAMLKVDIVVQYQKGWDVSTATDNDAGRGSVKAYYTAASGSTILNQSGRYYIGTILVYQNNLNS